MIINMHIERLVLDGIELAAGDGPILQAAVEAELGRLFSEGALVPQLADGGAFAALPAGDLPPAAEPGADALGRSIAAAVYGSIGR